ncbi:tRNA (N(6)-L-threonylcarbamoyladenosine(37)-C(2))-methylthiotransferase MtaB [Ruminococcus difficilis]|uniref:tRNA (N(6)-L-threonylcarbamoyladenosine(37)-C(2))-methylthiotransferase n=1 Tax=Ruminococcus difficilis TaxID=2763069 RepID=A0A934TZN3_9FIRM|nr:tRNA (N(6)-L-threonylcarbamoyladenosine(37)-C(2))-methylthiotransferase MtaB [Ruminococcus difficilis]MBK6087823.1 tRNA (N(6)-L-threonylcarbamoyladenosine(37)-C(2))-methylthiotransferase MtaB [Ruminococcus difficilis]
MKYYIMTLGCKVNQYESEVMAELLNQAGYIKAESYQDSDINIVNSCTVTATGDAKNRKLIRRIRRENPDSIIILCGCMPQAFFDDISVFEGCDIVMGNTARRDIIPLIEEFLMERRQIIRIGEHQNNEAFEPMRINAFNERTRACIKIEDGCNRFCTYCIIPYARGRVRSKELDEIRKEAEALAENGFKEIVLVGINLSAYGQEWDLNVYDAVKVVCQTDGIERVRLGSIEPERMTADILSALSKEPKFCPHFHLSLQAGCDTTLKRMHRHYDTAEYARIVADIRRLFDNPSITTDVMVGFVGESEEDFNASVSFTDEIGFAKTHVFPYSRRKGTAADKMDGHIDEHLKHKRADIMIAHTLEQQRRFMQSQVGLTEPVLFETRSKDGMMEGYTKNYTKVRVKDDRVISGEIYDVKLTEAYDDYCVGEI